MFQETEFHWYYLYPTLELLFKACDFISFHLDKMLPLDTVEDSSRLHEYLMF